MKRARYEKTRGFGEIIDLKFGAMMDGEAYSLTIFGFDIFKLLSISVGKMRSIS